MSEEQHVVEETEAVTAPEPVVEAPVEKKTRGRQKKEPVPVSVPDVVPVPEVVVAEVPEEKPKAKRKPRAPKATTTTTSIDVVPIDSAPMEAPVAEEPTPVDVTVPVETAAPPQPTWQELQRNVRQMRRDMKAERYKKMLDGKI